MLYSRSSEDEKFAFFSNFLEHILKGKDEYMPFVQTVIKDAHDLVNGNKNYYTIDREDYPIIVFLAQENLPFFQNLDINQISTKDYKDILGMISKQREVMVTQ